MYVDGPKALLHPIGREDVGGPSEFVKKVIFKAEERSGADDGGFGEYTADYFFAAALSRFRQLAVGLLEKGSTLVLKNSDGDSLLALNDDTCMNLSTSYLATASAIRSAPSTCTSSSVKFLYCA